MDPAVAKNHSGSAGPNFKDQTRDVNIDSTTTAISLNNKPGVVQFVQHGTKNNNSFTTNNDSENQIIEGPVFKDQARGIDDNRTYDNGYNPDHFGGGVENEGVSNHNISGNSIDTMSDDNGPDYKDQVRAGRDERNPITKSANNDSTDQTTDDAEIGIVVERHQREPNNNDDNEYIISAQIVEPTERPQLAEATPLRQVKKRHYLIGLVVLSIFLTVIVVTVVMTMRNNNNGNDDNSAANTIKRDSSSNGSNGTDGENNNATTQTPSLSPMPTPLPSSYPTAQPSSSPTQIPSSQPTFSPTTSPTKHQRNWLQLGNDILGNSDDRAGTSISVSRNGLSVAVGAPGWDEVFIYTYSLAGWIKRASIVGYIEFDASGQSVALDDSGEIVIVGAPFIMPSQSWRVPENFTAIKGRARVYRLNLNSTSPYDDNSYIQMGSDIVGSEVDDQFGWSVDISNDGTMVAIGSRNRCDVRVLNYNEMLQDWQDVFNVTDCDGNTYDSSFGSSVKLSGDGSVVAVGEPVQFMNSIYDQTDSAGRVHVYKYNGSEWRPMGDVVEGEAAGDAFGTSLALSDDGTVMAVGAPFNDLGQSPIEAIDTVLDPGIGSCRVFTYQSDVNKWIQRGGDIDGDAVFDTFGVAVSLNSAGDIVAIGFTGSNSNGDDSGSVQVFQYDFEDKKWLQVGEDIIGPFAQAQSGASVALSADGDIVTIGATNSIAIDSDRWGSARVYETGIIQRIMDFPVTVVVHTDEYPREIVWSVDRLDVEQEETVQVAASPIYTKLNKTESTTFFVQEGGVYRLLIYDKASDGFCCSSGEGWYEIFLSNSTISDKQSIIYGLGNFSNYKQHTFVARESDLALTEPSEVVTLEIDFDNRPEDIHWVLLSSEFVFDGDSGRVKAKRTALAFGPETEYGQEQNSPFIEVIDVSSVSRSPDSKLILIVTDSGRDGLCCQHGIGMYRLYNGTKTSNDDMILLSGDAEGKRRTVHTVALYSNN